MCRSFLPSFAFMVSLQGVLSATIPVGEEENLKNNLVGYEDDLVEGLTPPRVEAKNYYGPPLEKSDLGLENSYIVEIYNNHLIIKTTGLPRQIIKLNKTESEGIQNVSLSFVRLLNSSKFSTQGENEPETPDWVDVSPVITLSNSGVFLQFLNTSKVESNAVDTSPENRQILWDFLTKFTRNIFEDKLKQLELHEKYAQVLDAPTDSSAFQNFINFLWNMMKLSVEYSETAYGGWTTSQPDVIDRKTRSTTATLSAYEEPSPYHEFPSQEFFYRRKDVDSIFYGKGVI